MDLGCGTGRHATILARKGYKVYGVDRSEEMLAIAREENAENPKFYCGDVSNLQIGQKVDVVTALFHVVSYQTSNEGLMGTFKTAYDHLRPGGIFIFDFWYGPAVLSNKPETRLKELGNEDVLLYRFALPGNRPNENIVDVRYKILVKDKKSSEVEELSELHSMRYLFLPEIRYMLQSSGLTVEYVAEWLTNEEPGFDTWSVVAVARRNN